MTQIEDILYNEKLTREDKCLKIRDIQQEAEKALGILEGNWVYCNVCKDYYKTRSFYDETLTEDIQIKIYDDPINSGGNEYVSGTRHTTYIVCPKGHKKIIRGYTKPASDDVCVMDNLFH